MSKPRSREWLCDAEDYDAVRDALDEAVVLLRRVGGAVQIATGEGVLIVGAARQQVDAVQLQAPEVDLYATSAFVFRWEPFMPSARRVEAVPEPEPEQVEEPEAEPDEEPAAA